MNRYLVVIGQPWAYEVFWQVRRLPGEWHSTYTLPTPAEAARYRAVFFCHWSASVPQDVLDASECIGFHCTDLPFGRGGHPIQNCRLRGIWQQPITAYRMTAELDAGPIFAKSEPISLAGDYQTEVLPRFIAPVVELITRIVTADPPIEPVAQAGEVVRFHRLSEAELAEVNALQRLDGASVMTSNSIPRYFIDDDCCSCETDDPRLGDWMGTEDVERLFKPDEAYMPVPRYDQCRWWHDPLPTLRSLSDPVCVGRYGRCTACWVRTTGVLTDADFGCVHWEVNTVGG